MIHPSPTNADWTVKRIFRDGIALDWPASITSFNFLFPLLNCAFICSYKLYFRVSLLMSIVDVFLTIPLQ